MLVRLLALIGSTLILASVSALGPIASASAKEQPCSWSGESNANTENVADPDLDATYWTRQTVPVPGERLAIRGEYPAARYFSFHVYDSAGAVLDSIYDAEIVPDPGSSNPYRSKPRSGSGDSYTVYVDFTPKPSQPAPDTIYIGDTPQGTPTPTSQLIYRVYVPQSPTEPAGNVPLPQITLETTAGTTIEKYGACGPASIEGFSQLNEEIADTNWPSDAPTPPIKGATDPPTWSRVTSKESILANQQNAYLSTTISRQYTQLVVIHAKAPTFPNTRAGVPPHAKRQLRYWSFCNYSETTRVVSCAPDFNAAIVHGYYTYVISDPDLRPATATGANGVTWLPWGGAFSSDLLLYRQMLPRASFANAIQDVSETSSPETVMGAYFPSIAYCTTAVFEAGGWKACFKYQP